MLTFSVISEALYGGYTIAHTTAKLISNDYIYHGNVPCKLMEGMA